MSLLLVNSSGSTGSSGGAAGAVEGIITLAIAILLVVAAWKTFVKAGRPGWAALIPIYDLYVLVKIACRPGWWTVLLLIPVVNIVFAIIIYVDVAKAFGRSLGFGLGLAILGFIFWPLLAFGGASYVGRGVCGIGARA